MPKVSVIIPVYNTEKYLGKCLESLIYQRLKDIEIICINDGSTDSSAEILERYAAKDSRIKIITKENMGLSAARNDGIEIAAGEYIGFVDSDDYVDLSFFSKLYDAAENYNADIACATIIRKRKHSQKYRVHYTETNVYTNLTEKFKACDIPKCCYVWNKIYKADLIKTQKFKVGVYFEDVLWIPEVLKKSEKLVTVPKTNYYYMVNDGNSIVKQISDKKIQDSFNAKKYVVDFCRENDIELSKKEKTLLKSIKSYKNITYLKVKEFEDTEIFYLFGVIPIFKRGVKNA